MRSGEPERRGTDRPQVGDVAQCPVCLEGTAEFTERYRMSVTRSQPIIQVPAWVCNSCRYAQPVRAEHRRRQRKDDV
jgi:hypothetical protein